MEPLKHAPGVVCYLRDLRAPDGSPSPYNGRTCTLIESEYIPLIHDYMWRVEMNDPVLVRSMSMGDMQTTRTPWCRQAKLVPIAGPGLITEDNEELEKINAA